jgi:L-ascorbate metabolism protein UlaG (beta-lactamase superfamily)
VSSLSLIRHATLVADLDGTRVLVDPMLDDAGARPAIADTPAQRPNPLVPMPPNADELMSGIDAIVVTHLHADHFDTAAAERLDKGLPLLCQPADADTLADRGFGQVQPVESSVALGGMVVHRTGARHGHGAMADRLGPVSGFVLEGARRVYVAGDTVWCDEVQEALVRHRPDVTVVNAGGARFLEGDPITMDAADVVATARAHPAGALVAVHMEAINHCLITRADLRRALDDAGVRATIPADGETIEIGTILGGAGPDSSAG